MKAAQSPLWCNRAAIRLSERVLSTYITDPQTGAILLPNSVVGHVREQLSAAPSFWNQRVAEPLLSAIFQCGDFLLPVLTSDLGD